MASLLNADLPLGAIENSEFALKPIYRMTLKPKSDKTVKPILKI